MSDVRAEKVSTQVVHGGCHSARPAVLLLNKIDLGPVIDCIHAQSIYSPNELCIYSDNAVARF